MRGFLSRRILAVLVAVVAVCLWVQTGVILAQTATEKPVEQKAAPAKVEREVIKEVKPAAASPKSVIVPATEVEMQRRFNELKSEVLDARAAYIDRWLAATAIFLTLLGILGIIGGYIGLSKFWEIEADARRSVEEINERNEETRQYNEEARLLVEEIKEHRSKSEEILEDLTAEAVADDPEKARQVAEDIRENPESSLIDRAIGDAILLQEEQKFDSAIEKWRAVAKIAEGSDNALAARAWVSIGYLLLEQGKHEEGIVANDEALKLNPELARAYHNRGNGKGALGRHEDAIKDYDEALSLRPDYALAYYNRGNAKGAMGRVKDALADYDEAISLNPDINAAAYSNRGNMKFMMGRPEEAISDYDEAISMNPADLVAYGGRGHAYVALGNTEAARRDFEKARDLARAAGEEDLAASVERDLKKLDEQ